VDRFSLEGQIAIVTGASRGIGRAIALAFAEAGADVAVLGRTEGRLRDVAGEIEARGRRGLPLPCDASDADAVRAAVDRAREALGTVDILVNNAGAAPFRSEVMDTRLEGFEKYLRINFLSALYGIQAVGPLLLEKGSGCVLNVASIAGVAGEPGIAYYGTAKAAMINLTKTVALEWARLGVRVNALAPGWVATDINAQLREDPERYRRAVEGVPMGRFGTVDEIAPAAVFLCSPAASFITGAVLTLDGGQTASTGYR